MILLKDSNMIEKKDLLKNFFEQQNSSLKKIFDDVDTIEKIVNVLIEARDKGSQIFTMGNGGSGSTASHFVSDLLKTSITESNSRFKAVSLVDNIPVLLAWANDVSYEDIFVEQLRNFLTKDDVVIGFSGSGKSKNVLNAMKFAKEKKATCIGFTGMSGGDLPKFSDICFIVPENDMLIIESMHLMICHSIVSTIRNLGIPKFTY